MPILRLQVDRTVNDMLKNLNIKTYSSYYFESWSCDFDHAVTSVTFMSQFKMIQIACSAFFYYGKKGVDEDAFVGKIAYKQVKPWAYIAKTDTKTHVLFVI